MNIDYREMQIDLIRKLNRYLEDACAYKTTREKELFLISSGRADAIRDILEEYFEFYESNYSEHTANMVEIVEYEGW